MRKVLGALAVVALMAVPASAGVWETQCAGCHNGSVINGHKILSKDELKAKYKSAKAFVDAALRVNDPMMASYKNNKKLLEEAAKEIYGK